MRKKEDSTTLYFFRRGNGHAGSNEVAIHLLPIEASIMINTHLSLPPSLPPFHPAVTAVYPLLSLLRSKAFTLLRLPVAANRAITSSSSLLPLSLLQNTLRPPERGGI